MDKIIVSVIIPTLNAGKTLKSCLTSIVSQKYPQKQLEIIIADGGSIDNTLTIATKFQAKIINNPLKTAEAGKMIALKKAQGTFIALIDSDNILPTPEYVNEMLEPLKTNPDSIGAEPIAFTYRPHAGFIERYCALLGANDPYAYFSQIYDRSSLLSGKWTGLKISTRNFPNYVKVWLYPNHSLPTIGANGTIFRKSFLDKYLPSTPYLFDIDCISLALTQKKYPIKFLKIKNSIIHTYCESSIPKFVRKQKRRISDYYFYKKYRQFNWSSVNKHQSIKFILYSFFIIGPVKDSFKGYHIKNDIAWFFHPLACLITATIYIIISLEVKIGKTVNQNRFKWQQ